MYTKCEYHVVFVPKYRFQVLAGTLKVQVGQDLFAISQWKEVEVLEQNVQADHVHMICSISPKISNSGFMGLLKGKLAMRLFQSHPELKQKPYWGNYFWERVTLLAPLVWMKT